jgi:uncharacterized protein (DUF1330 family)
MYRTNDGATLEVIELRTKLNETEAELAKLRNKKPLGESMSNWWSRNSPSDEFCFFALLFALLAAVGARLIVASAETDSINAMTEVRATQMAVEHFRSPRVSVKCFGSPEHGMLCEIRSQNTKLMVRCDTETCWRML